MVYEANTEYDADSLFHYGVVGMHWGIRRYQPYSYTDGRDYGESGKEIGLAAKLGRGIKSAKNSIEAYRKTAKKKATLRKARRTKAAKAKAAEKEEKKRVKEEKKKEELINSGDIDKVIKNKSKLTTDEIRRATDRIVAESKLRDIESEEALKAIERGKRLVSSVADMTRNVGSIYDTVSGISKKMNEKEQAARKKAEEKRMNDIIKPGNAAEIDKAIRNGDLTPEYAKKGMEVVESRYKMINFENQRRNQENKQAEAKKAEADKLFEKTQAEYKKHYEEATASANTSKSFKTKGYSYEDAVNETRDRLNLNKKDDNKITLKLNDGNGEYDPIARASKEKKTKASNAAKAGWQTRREKHAAKLQSDRESQLSNLISEYQKSSENDQKAKAVQEEGRKSLNQALEELDKRNKKG